MDYRKINHLGISVSPISLGTWAFGGGSWWGPQDDLDSIEAIEAAIKGNVTLIDTAPVYGRGRSEKIIGNFLRKRKLREKIILATKAGLSWQGSKIFHNLKRKRILQEIDESRSRLETDYIDLYQVHWPDQDTPIAETAEVFYKLQQQKIIKAVGVSNYSVEQMAEFKKYCPLDALQPEYSLFERAIEPEVIPFCQKNNIAIITYAPLYSGLLTGKFFLNQETVPEDTNRKLKSIHFKEPFFSLNKKSLEKLSKIAAGYKKSLAQLAINWNFSQAGITSAIVGSRNLKQIKENLGSVGWKISQNHLNEIKQILTHRQAALKNSV